MVKTNKNKEDFAELSLSEIESQVLGKTMKEAQKIAKRLGYTIRVVTYQETASVDTYESFRLNVVLKNGKVEEIEGLG